jgi:hypothetical protein
MRYLHKEHPTAQNAVCTTLVCHANLIIPSRGEQMSDVSVDGSPTTGAPFRVGVVLSKTFSVFSGKLGNFLLLALIPLAPLLLFVLIAQAGPQGGLLAPNAAWIAALSGILTFVLGIVAHATTLYGAFRLMGGQSFTVAQSLDVGFRRALPVFGTALLAGLGTFVATIFFLVPGLIVACMLYVAIPACVIEKLSAMDSLHRSATLTKGYRWQVFGLLALVAIAGGVVQFVLTRVGGGMLFGKLLEFCWQVVATSFGAVLAAVVYHDLRVAKEGIAIDNLANVFD